MSGVFARRILAGTVWDSAGRSRRFPVTFWVKVLAFPFAFVWVLRWKLAAIAAVWWTVLWLNGRPF